MIRVVVFLVFLAGLSGCASLTPQQCADGAWYEIGLVDGRFGRPTSELADHRRDCGNVDEIAYTTGRLVGLRDYCRPEHGFAVGERSLVYSGVCAAPEFDETAFLAERQRGQLLAEGRSRREALAKRSEEAMKEAAKPASGLSQVFSAVQYLTGSHPTQLIARDRADIEVRVASMEDAAPPTRLSTEMMADDHAMEWSIAGASIGTVAGFGLGHAVQGRWLDSGWKWTAAEGLGLAAVIAASNSFCVSERDPVRGGERSSCSNGVPAVAALALIGVHIWQAVDLWSEAGRVSRGYSRANLTIVPRVDVPGVVAVVGF